MSELLHDDETWVRELLAPLERIEPVELPAPASRRPRVPRRPLAVAACVVATLVLATGVAVAAGVNPLSGIAAFVGIGAVDHPQTAEDALSPKAAANMAGIAAFETFLREHGNAEHAQRMGEAFDFVPDSARLVGELPGDHKIYAVATRKGSLCVVTNTGVGCSPAPGTDGRPGTLASSYLHATYGITTDGVTAVSFMAEGREQTVQVVDNFWIYEGKNSASHSITFHLADGRTHTTTHFRRDGTSGTIDTLPDGSTHTTTRFRRADGTTETTVTTTP